MRDSVRYAWKEIKRRKRRSVGAIISYAFVGAILIIISTLADTTRDSAQSVLVDIGAHSVAYIPRLTVEGCCIQKYATDRYDPDREGFIVNNAPSNIIPEESIKKIQESPCVADASPYLMFRIRASIGTGEWVLGGIDLTKPIAYRNTVVAESQVMAGQFLKPEDKNKIMVESEFASSYKLEPGSELRLGDSLFKVAAIVQPPLRPGKANIYMSLGDLRELVASRLDEPLGANLANAVLVESKGAQYHQQALNDISSILGQSSRISSFGCSQPGISAMGINKNTAWTISIIVIVCMFLLAMKIQYSSVIQRRFDIGVLKAIGWSDQDIFFQVLTESVFYALTGAIVGITAAYIVICSLPAGFFSGMESKVNTFIFLSGIILPLAGGLISGILSSLKAVNLSTAKILRMI
jgi:putative ABC transport system permease protein